MTEKKPTRKGSTPIVVRVTPDEKAIIESYAQQTGQSTSAYLRLLGQGYVPKKHYGLWQSHGACTYQW